MKLEDCPNCFTEVLPMAGRVCPACNAPFGPPSDWVMLLAHDGDVLPRFCVTCAAPTGRLERVSRKRVPKAEIPWWLIPFTFMMGALGLVLAYAAWKDRERVADDTRAVEVDLPHCPACVEKHPLDVRYVDFERVRISVVAHRQYRDLVALARKQQIRG